MYITTPRAQVHISAHDWLSQNVRLSPQKQAQKPTSFFRFIFSPSKLKKRRESCEQGCPNETGNLDLFLLLICSPGLTFFFQKGQKQVTILLILFAIASGCTLSRMIWEIFTVERFSNECLKTNIKVITLTNHNGSKKHDEPIRTPGNYL